ncbi:hypothetical protein [Pseudomonas mucidolens]|uniref:hypothetical protein n=1 Tax=Pseudomonas mucidolens TaxID=46679 RepID=UPI0030D901E1
MITEIKVTRTKNAFQSNDVINLGSIIKPDKCSLSAISWTTTELSWRTQLSILEDLYTRFNSAIPEQNIWLLIGSYSWQPDSRIIRHRRLWGCLKARGMEVLHGKNYQDVLTEGREGVKFFGAVTLSEPSLMSTLFAILSERCSYIVGLPKDCDVSFFLNSGWKGKITDDINLICGISNLKGFVLKPIGEFDDPERGFLYLGSSDVARKINTIKVHTNP